MSMIKPSHRGLLHKKLGVPEGKKIPEAKIEKAKESKSPALRKEATFAENFGHKSKLPMGEHHKDNHRAPSNHDEFHKMGGKGY